ncbi:MAG: TolC family protein [Myxococcales bacterium]|nr:TolC family protein [Myxococcales bacterium]
MRIHLFRRLAEHRHLLLHSAVILAVGCVPARPADTAEGTDGHAARSLTADAPSGEGPRAAPAAAGSPLSAERRPAAPGQDIGARLDRAQLVRAVLTMNPDIEARRAAWRAARSKRRQADTLDDPMLGYEFAPLSIFSGMRFGQTVRVSQRFPWPGKLSSLSDAEERAADASGQEIKLTELDFAMEASLLFDEYWLVDRSLEVNAEHRRLLDEMRSAAEIQYSVGRASLSDPLQADVEIAMLEEQDLGLGSRRDVVTAELNALLHRPPERALPAPPLDLGVSLSAPPPSSALQREALMSSPELKRLAAKTRAAQARVRYAEKQYYPDVTLMASYSSMFAEIEHQFMVGFETPIPIQRGSRAGMVDEASAMASESRHESSHIENMIRSRVEIERRRVIEGIAVVKLYDGRLIPTAKSQVAAARADFTGGKTGFSEVISAEKSLRNIQLSRHAAAAELSKRRTQLDRALGRLPAGVQKGGAK